MSAITEVALDKRVDAVHPGYGFLSENSSFAEICRDINIIFIGPSAKVMKDASDKALMVKKGKRSRIICNTRKLRSGKKYY